MTDHTRWRGKLGVGDGQLGRRAAEEEMRLCLQSNLEGRNSVSLLALCISEFEHQRLQNDPLGSGYKYT